MFVLALGIRVVHLWQLRSAPFFTVLIGDAAGYDLWARRLAAGDWIGTEVFYQAPLYPYVLGVIYYLFGADVLLVRVVQAVIGSLGCVALSYAGLRLLGRRGGTVCGVVLALYPSAIFFDALIQKSALDLFFTCVTFALVATIVAGAKRPWLIWFLLGATLAALSLTRENALLLVAVILLWALLRQAWGPAILFVVGLALFLLPVAARNAAVGGGFYLTTSQFGSNFFIGNNPRSDGTYMALRAGRGAPEFERVDAKALAEQAVGRPLSPADVSNYWFGRALAYIRSEPGQWLRLMVRKASLLVNTSEMLDSESQESHADYSAILRTTATVGRYGILIPLAVLGMFVLWPRHHQLWIVYALLLTYAASVVVFFVMARYRHPLLPFLVFFATAGVLQGRDYVRSASRAQLATAAAVVLAAAAIANRPMLSPTLMRAITEHNLATALQEQGRLDDAIAHYQRAIAIQHDYAPAYNNLGTALMAKDDLPAAVAAFRESLRLQPDSTSAKTLLANAEYDLGSALVERGAFDRAEALFRDALRLNPNSAEAHNNLGIALAQMNRVDEAVREWKTALSIRPGFADAQRNLDLALRR